MSAECSRGCCRVGQSPPEAPVRKADRHKFWNRQVGRWVAAVVLLQQILYTCTGRHAMCFGAPVRAPSKSGRGIMLNAKSDSVSDEGISQWSRAFGVLAEVQKAKLQSDVTMWNAAISVAEEGGTEQMALDLIEFLIKDRLNPNQVTSDAMTKAATGGASAADGAWRQTLSDLAALREKEGPGDSQPWQHAIDLLDTMQTRLLRVGSISLGSTLQACLAVRFHKHGIARRWATALELYKTIYGKDVMPDPVCCGSLIAECEQRGLSSVEVDIIASLETHDAIQGPEDGAAFNPLGEKGLRNQERKMKRRLEQYGIQS
eukprot:TRINITY_DN32545_c0_g1_i1.p1 TRINITY_DN32545_c0_g1~~TRINITY_DN32545_c0_g1_i1.p1  ORF type:complete len:317 (-),score=43.26 TRINITY_DN32545_c0_g1_i1:144-1094(-)